MLVLFDIDDTLIDHSAAVRHGVTALFEQIRPAEHASAFHASWVAAMKMYFPRYLARELSYQDHRRARMRQSVGTHLSDAQADELFDVYFRVYETKWSLFSDVLPCLDELDGHRLGIISNGNGAEQRSKLERTGIADRFEFVHISDDCGHAKPAAEIFLRACTMAGVAPQDAMYIGDLYEIDAIGARAAGLHGVWLNRDATQDREHAPPTIRGLDELPSLVRGRGPSHRSSGDVIFRRATNRDCAAAQRVVDGALREYNLHAILDGGDVDLTDIETYYDERRGQFELIEDGGGEVLGVLAWKSTAGVVELKKLYLVPAARGRGIGRRALARVVDAARGAGARAVVLETSTALKEANQLYTRFGFVEARGTDAGPFANLSEQCDMAYRLDLSRAEA